MIVGFMKEYTRRGEGRGMERGGVRGGERRVDNVSLKKRMQVKFLLVIITRFFSGEGREKVFLNNTSQKHPF